MQDERRNVMSPRAKFLCVALALLAALLVAIIAGQVVATVFALKLALNPSGWMVAIWGLGSTFFVFPAAVALGSVGVSLYDRLGEQ